MFLTYRLAPRSPLKGSQWYATSHHLPQTIPNNKCAISTCLPRINCFTLLVCGIYGQTVIHVKLFTCSYSTTTTIVMPAITYEVHRSTNHMIRDYLLLISLRVQFRARIHNPSELFSIIIVGCYVTREYSVVKCLAIQLIFIHSPSFAATLCTSHP